jgi:glycosyltransferase involved in cell wall biosynthesis
MVPEMTKSQNARSPKRQGARGKKRERPLLLLAARRPLGGLGVVFLSVARGMAGSGRDVTVAWSPSHLRKTTTPLDDRPDAALAPRGARFEPAASAWRQRPLRLAPMWRLWRVARRHPGAIVNMHVGGSQAALRDLVALRLAGVRTCVVSVHGMAPIRPELRWLQRWRSMLFSILVAPSEPAARAAVANGVPGHKVRVIANGAQAPVPGLTREVAREQLGIPPETFVVACAGRLVAAKGVADLIQAMSQMTDGTGHLVVAGEGAQRAELEKRARTSIPGRASFLGWLKEGPGLVYAAADVFALPSKREAFGLVFAEAAAWGLPCVAYAIPGIEGVVVDGKTGLLAPPGDVAAFAAALDRLAADPKLRAEMSSAATQHSAGMTETAMVAGYDALFTELSAK